MRQIRSITGLALALLLAVAAGVVAQEEEESSGGIFIDTVDVNVVNVDVYVTDKKGNRITGLTREDFELSEDGRPVAITNFSAFEEGLQLGAEASKPEPVPTLEPKKITAEDLLVEEIKIPPPPENQRLHLVVYVDNFNISPFSRNRVMKELRQFLRENVTTNDQVMLVTYDRELHVRHTFTNQASVIARGLQELETFSGHGVHRDSERRDALERIDESESAQEALSYAKTYAGSIFNDVAFTVDALRDIVNGLGGLPGRKAILYVSEGLPMRAGEDLFYAVNEKYRENSALTYSYDYDATRKFKALTGAANANRTSFYTIDAGGLRTYSYSDASHATAGQGSFVERIYISNYQSSLQFMAEETGGKAIINRNRVLPALQEVAGDFRSYYSLGFQPSHSGDGRYHRIQVKLADKRKGVRLRHRDGYRDKPLSIRMADGTTSALLHRYETNPMGVELAFGTPNPTDKGRFMVPLNVSIPLGKLVMLPAEGNHEARLRLWVAVMDEEGDLSEVQETPLPISIPTNELERARGQSYLYSVRLLMRRGPHRVAIGIRDDVGAESSFITRELTIGR